jgi:diaminobutyrate-2-oxoglutarate transaminase
MSVATLYDTIESSVRSYSRTTPVVFKTAKGHQLFSTDGVAYLDFLAGCGALNYGHNDPDLKAALIDYINVDGLAMGLDFYFDAKTQFLEDFDRLIMKPRGLSYKLQFVGPTGTNAVEAALKIARKATGKANIISFTNGYHGCTLGALAATGNQSYRTGSQGLLTQSYRAIYDGYMPGLDSAALLDQMMSDASSGMDNVAAVILEGVQGEGGLNVASPQWAQKIAAICKKNNILLIVDEVQTGCGRCGDFFSFESLGIKPDIITLAKSLSGYGLPMAMTMIRPDIDVWQPAEHSGTFRGNAHAFVTASAALRKYWSDDMLMRQLDQSAVAVTDCLTNLSDEYGLQRKGRGMLQGLDVSDPTIASHIQNQCLENGVLIESCGPNGEVLKILAALNIPNAALMEGLSIFESSVKGAINHAARTPFKAVS